MSLSNLSELAKMLGKRKDSIFASPDDPLDLGKLGKMHCPTCSESTMMNTTILNFRYGMLQLALDPKKPVPNFQKITRPMVLLFRCVNCPTEFAAFIYCGPVHPEMAIFPDKTGGFATPHTPEIAGYYVNQAYLAQSAGAFSAAMAMYRAALNQILWEFGSKDLESRINGLEAKIKDGSAPPWARRFNTEMFKLLMDIGDSQMHGRDVDRESQMDADFLNDIGVAFSYLLYKRYEEEEEQKASKAKVDNAVKPKKTGKAATAPPPLATQKVTTMSQPTNEQ